MALLDVKGMDMAYGPVQILFGVDFAVEQGEIVALLGTNGAGKSTLLKGVCGLVKPKRGTVHFKGDDITGLSADEIRSLLDASRRYQDPEVRTDALAGRTVVNLFLEPSTRTRTSFEIAAKRLGADVVNVAAAASSLVKGETLVDTTRNIDAMRPSDITISQGARPSASGTSCAASATRHTGTRALVRR